MRIVLLGPPGVGKGTQGLKLASRFNAAHISTGDMLRQIVRDDTPIGDRIRNVLADGQLVADELIIELVETRLSEPDGSSFVLDGFPRTIKQAEALDLFLNGHNQSLTAAVLLTATDEELERRILARSETDGRSDDNAATIARRLQVYRNQTQPLVEYYERNNKLVSILSEGSIDSVFTIICDKLQVLTQ